MEITVYLRPKTGMQKGKFRCIFGNESIHLIKKREALLETEYRYIIPYNKMVKFDDKNYFSVPGLEIYVKENSNLELPPTPSLGIGGIIGMIISSIKTKSNRFVLYFDSDEDKEMFIENAKKINNEINYK